MAASPFIGAISGVADTLWHLLLDGPMILLEAAAGFTLSITSDPSGASILLDGSDTGATTPAEIGDVFLAVHNVTVVLDGYLPGINESVEGAAGETTAVHFDLPATGGERELRASGASFAGGPAPLGAGGGAVWDVSHEPGGDNYTSLLDIPGLGAGDTIRIWGDGDFYEGGITIDAADVTIERWEGSPAQPLITNTSGAPAFAVTADNATFSGLNISENRVTTSGAGIFATGGEGAHLQGLTITDCTFAGNKADVDGGALYAKYVDNVQVERTTFTANKAGQKGGGAYFYKSHYAVLTETTFANNTADRNGGGVRIDQSENPVLKNTTFANNTAGYAGGGAYFLSAPDPTLTSTTFANNTATESGGGAYFVSSDGVALTETTFENNTAGGKGGGAYFVSSDGVALTETMFANNTATEFGGGAYFDSSKNAVLTKMTFENNTAGYAGGGAYFGSSKNAVLTKTTFANNTAATDGGGAYFESSDDVALTETTFANNTATESGGGAYFGSSKNAVLTETTFANNTANDSGGGAAFGWSKNAVLTNTTFTNNTAGYAGGAYFESSDDVALTETTFANNTANSGGGAYFDWSKNAVLTETTFANNTAGYAGGAYFGFSDNAILTETTFANNTATNNIGGGAYFDSSPGATLTETTFANNTKGGGAHFERSNNVILTKTTFTGNTAESQAVGGASFSNSENVAITDCTFVENEAAGSGGALNTKLVNNVQVERTTFTANTAGQEGGGAYFSASNGVVLTETTFANNTATESGGGAYFDFSPGATLTETTFSNNTAEWGGGTHFASSENAALTKTTFANNTADWDGGGAHFVSSSHNAVLTETMFENNTAGGKGGGVCIDQSHNVVLTETTFENNTAELGGGAFFLSAPGPNLTETTFANNTATVSGGGAYFGNSPDAVLTNTTFANNAATEAGGGAYFDWSWQAALTNTTFANNTAATDGGGAYFTSSADATLTNTTFASNTATETGGGAAFVWSDNVVLTETTFANNTATESGGGAYFDTSKNAAITNCRFDNPTNIYAKTSSAVLNGTRSAGTNIAGGPYLGGNLWLTDPLQNISERGPDTDLDGICDESFTIAGFGTDHLPLAYVGTVTVNSTPGGATIHLNGSETGHTTNTTLSLLAGTHNLTVTLAGYVTPENETVTVKAGEAIAVSFNLEMVPPPIAGFTANATRGAAPLAVQFTDTSTGDPASWKWEFGDGEISTDRNPIHTYAADGTYTVSLTVASGAGEDTLIRSGYITVAVPPETAFSGTPTSGPVPLTVTFTDESTGGPTGWAWFFGDETYGGAWALANASAGWSARTSHTCVALADGSIVLAGGHDGSGPLNDTWRSTDNGVTWMQLPDAGWPARFFPSSVVLPDGSIVLAGGVDSNYSRLNDTWRSTDGGITWTCVNASAGWSARAGHSSVALADGSIVLAGGADNDGFKNDTWRSTDGGITWTCVNASAGWSARIIHASVALTDGSIVLAGGADNDGFKNDTWRSTDGGTIWTCVNASAEWPARSGHTSVALADGSIVLAGGQGDSGPLNDTWRSTDAGATWMQLPNAGWPARSSHASVALTDGSIVLAGGTDDSGPLNDTWRLQPAGSTDRNPTHEYTAVGTYSVTLQAYNNGGYNSTHKVDYIAVLEPLAANFTGTPTSGIAPLTVSFTDASAGSPTAWNWSFGDGATSAEQNPTHTYTAAGNYSVRLTVARVGEDTCTKDDYITVVVPPVANFTGTPTSGSAPLNVSFTDHSTGATGWVWFFGDETYGDAWTNQTAAGGEPGWSGRIGHSSVALADGSIVLAGGAGGSGNDVWRSTDAGATWTCVNASAGWSARYGHTSVALADGSIVLMGGMGGSGNDTWRSTDNGATWACVNASAGWSARGGHTSVALADGSIVLAGGQGDSGPLNDTWRSTDNGATWACVNASAGWSARGGHTSVALADGSIVLAGGQGDSDRLNDTWRSTDNGITWTCVNASAGWSARIFPSSVALADGSIMLMGGQEDGSFIPLGDTWRSTDNGATWTQLPNTGWSARFFLSSVALRDGSIVLMGGMGEGPLNDVWRLQPAGSTAQNPTHEYTAPGTYSVALQAYNNGGYNSTHKVDYITVVIAPTVTGIEPDSGKAGSSDPTVRTVRGTGFVGTPTVTLVDGPTTVTAENVTVLTDTKLTCTFDLATAPAGAYDVRVTNENGTGTLVDAFTVYTTLPAMFHADHYRSGIYPDTGIEIPGTVKWTFATEGPVGYPSPCVYDGIVYIGSNTADYTYANIYALNTSTGAKVWNYTMEHVVWSSACVNDGILYVGSADNSLHAVDATTGTKVWTFPTGEVVQSSPCIHDGVIYVGSLDSNIYAVNAETGAKIWDFATGDAVLSSPAVCDGIVYAGSYDHNVYAIDAATGAEIWRFLTESVVDSSPSVAGGVVYVGSGDHNIYALDAATGAQKWAFTTGDYVFSTPCVSNGVVYVGSNDHNVYALDAGTGTEVWRFQTGDAVWSSPCISGGIVYVGSCDAKIYALDVVTGAQKWNVTTGDAVYSSPCVSDGVVYIGSVDGMVYAIGPTTPVANFTANVTAGLTPLAVAFTDASTGYPTAWAWDFGDGNTSTERNANHTYANPGTYTVSLNASNTYGYNVSAPIPITVLEPPAATFTANVTEGNVPLTVKFTDTSMGNVTAWDWNFGDGTWFNTTNPAERNATHIYATAGTFTVILNASNAYGYSVKTEANYITVLAPPTAGFTANVTEGNVPLAVQFTDNSTGNVTAWAWDFGDGNTSTMQTPNHTYEAAGNYTVSLNASNAYGYNVSAPTTVAVLAPPRAAFTANQTEGNVPLAVQFSDTSTGNVTAWAWDFGDGNTSLVQSPAHTYEAAGNYTVSLNASNVYGFSVKTEAKYITVLAPPRAAFAANVTEGNTPLAVQFADTSTGNVTAWVWDFGDGNKSTVQSPSHTYEAAGTYTVTLNASNTYGYSVSAPIPVTVLAPPAAAFTANQTEGNKPLAVQFTDTSTGNVTAWDWSFGDGTWLNTTNPVERNATHTYANPGTYTVTLNASNTYGYSVNAPIPITVLAPPTAAFTANQTEGNKPLFVQFTDESAGNVTAWDWNFGDGAWFNTTNPTERNATHIYTNPGTFTVILNASNTYGYNVSAPIPVTVLEPPAADFTANVTEGNMPLAVRFADESAGNVTAWDWSFGDGTLFNTTDPVERNATHTYEAAGNYTVSLNASNAYGYSVSAPIPITVLAPPTAAFTANFTEGNVPLAVQFTDESAGNVTAWDWNFGDGTWFNTTNPAERNATHTYTNPGTFTVILNASNTYGFSVKTEANSITVLTPPAAAFTANVTEGNMPLAVQFTDTSTGNVTAWDWNSGDGTWFNTTNPVERNATHTYTNPGAYTVILNASNTYGYSVSAPTTVAVLESPAAGFTANVTEGNAPLAVQFTDESAGNVTAWAWDFGDGNTSTERNATHIYANPGAYTITLNASNTYGYSVSAPIPITVLEPPTAGFTVNVTEGNVPLTVKFADTSMGNVTAWDWNFGDGTWFNTTNPAERNATHTYASAGTYTVTLNASNAYGYNVSAPIPVTVLEPPAADFTANVTEGNMPLAVQFTDESAGNVTTWDWNFGDGTWFNTTNPAERNATHTYTNPGTFTVILNASNTYGFSVKTETNYITVLTPPAAAFTANVTEGNMPLAVQFTDESAGNVTAWDWNFGDGAWFNTTNPAERNTTHIYANPGAYTVSLNASNAYGFSVKTETDYVTVLAPPVAGFTANVTEGNKPLAVQFTDTSMGNVTAWDWDFGDGNTSTVQHPAHTYTGTGTFTVTLNASNVYGFSVKTEVGYITVLAPPAADFTTNVTEGNAPLAIQFTDTSTGNVTAWDWDFGDGTLFNTTNLAERNATHTYANAGTYIVTLNASNTYGYNVSAPIPVTVLEPPTAGFTANVTEGNMPLSVQFTDTSIGNVTAWAWDFGDGNTSTVKSPTHTYTGAGNYSVTLNASNAYGFSVKTEVSYITVLAPPTAGFTANVTEGNAPLAVQFTDNSTGNVTAWDWDFGEGTWFNTTNPVERNATHTYTSAGNYTIILNASNAYGFSVKTEVSYITVLAPPAADFTANVTEGNAPLAIQFTDTSTGNVTAWDWDFGDGETSTDQYPVHTYATADNYTVTLNASNTYGFSVKTETNYITVLAPPVAAFTTNVTEGNMPLSVQFTDNSTGNVTAWDWDFGDGNTSADQHPTHTYASAGNYTVILNASNAYGFAIKTETKYITVLESPAAAFIANVTEGNMPLPVRFTDKSAGNVTAWVWDFGDGNTSTVQSPTYTYVTAGNYTVTLNASNAHGFSVKTEANYITVLAPPAAAFSGNVTEGNMPLAVRFTDESTGNVTAWAWGFGDGNTSADQHPIHNYIAAGTYTVTLNASNVYGFSAKTEANYITVLAPPAATFTANVTEGNTPLAVQFTDTSTGNVTAWDWDFGDGNTSTVQHPAHTYTGTGNYTVTLNASNAYGFSAKTEANYITVLASPAAVFTANVTEGNSPLAVQFTDESVGNVTAWSWDFGDGNTSTVQSPSHTYKAAGNYTVTLNASNAYEFSVRTEVDYITVLAPPTAAFTANVTEGNVPLAVQFTDTSTGNVTAWSWDFGDGNTSTVQNPTHTYEAAGNYTVSLNASNAYGSSISAPIPITVLAPPAAAFTANVTEGNMPLAVLFTDKSAGNVTAWAWNFGDGNTSAVQNPTHTYTSAGNYSATLNASNAYGSSISAPIPITVLEPPAAAFTANITEGNTPLPVRFTDKSAGNVTAWVWDFGDGNTSTVQSPTYTYVTAGNYTVTLNASNAHGFSVKTEANYITVLATPRAAFAGNVTEGNMPLAVRFTDESTGNVTAWAWDFGDGNTSLVQHPTHTYTGAGNYSVTLNASNTYGFSVRTEANYITVLATPRAAFTANVTEGNAPLAVQFTDTSGGNVAAWAWDFGDGNTSLVQHPTHTYTSAGNYSVTLNASNACGSSISAPTTITVLESPRAAFTTNVTEGNAPLAVRFADISTGNVTAWSWNFGDGNTSTVQSPTHTYEAAGTYTVILNASNTYGSSISAPTTITVLAPPAAALTANVTEGNMPLAVRFTDTSTGNVTAWAWDFGDGNTSSVQNPSHTYVTAGTCTVILNASNAYGSSISAPTTITVLPPPRAAFTTNVTEGNTPLAVQFTDTSTGNVTVWAWNFGEGTWFNTTNPVEQNATHTYTAEGAYTVTLNVSNAYGWNSVTRPSAVTATSPDRGGGRDGGGGGINSTPTPTVSVTPTITSTPTPTPAPVVVELTTDPEGQVIETIEIIASDTVGALTIPGGVQARDAAGGNLREIIIEPIDPINLTETHDVAENITTAYLFGQYAYRVGPSGATFNPPITLTFYIPRDVWATLDAPNMSVMWQETESGAWEKIPIALIEGNETHVWVSAAITHFSTYELFMPRIDLEMPAEMPAEPTTPWFLWIIILIVIGTALYIWSKRRQNQGR